MRRKKTDAQEEYEEWVQKKMDAIDTPQELIGFIEQECRGKTRSINDALDKLVEVLNGNTN
jgi:hypothetical protein